MPGLAAVVLWTHIAAGAVALVAGVGALLARKGGWTHRRAGTVFVGAMAVVVGTVFALVAIAATRERVILSLIAAFSGYLAYSGYRIVQAETAPATVDWATLAVVGAASLTLGAWGLAQFLGGRSFGVVMTVFGGIGVGVVGLDTHRFRTPDPGAWRVAHLQRMVAAVIATVSAVSAVNLGPVLGVWAWLWPTLVGSPLIAYWSSVYDHG